MAFATGKQDPYGDPSVYPGPQGTIGGKSTGGNKGLDLSHNPDPGRGGRKGRDPGESEEDKFADRLRDKLEDLAVAYRTAGDASKDASDKNEILFGNLAFGNSKAQLLSNTLGGILLTNIKAVDKASMDLFGHHYSTNRPLVEGANGLLQSPDFSFGTMTNQQKQAGILAMERIQQDQADRLAAAKAMQAKINEVHAEATQAAAKTQYDPVSLNGIAVARFGKTFDNLSSTQSKGDVSLIFQRKWNEQMGSARKIILRGLDDTEEEVKDKFASKMFGGSTYAELGGGVLGAVRRGMVNTAVTNAANKQAAKDAETAAEGYDSYTKSIDRYLATKRKERDDAGAKDTDASRRRQAILDAQNGVAVPDASKARGLGDVLALGSQYLNARNQAGILGGQTNAAQNTARYAQNYADSMKALRAELTGYKTETDAARIATVEFDVNGIKQMEYSQAALVVAMQKSVEKMKELRETMKQVAQGVGDLFGNTLKFAFDHGFKGLFSNLLQQTKQFLQQMTIQILQAQATKWLTKQFTPQAATATQITPGGAATGGVFGGLGSVLPLIYGRSQGASATGASVVNGQDMYGPFSAGPHTDPGIGGSTLGGLNSIFSLASMFVPGLRAMPHFATGGRFSAGEPVVVGDRNGMRNAEVAVFDHSGRIDPRTGGMSSTSVTHAPTIVMPSNMSPRDAEKTGRQAARAYKNEMSKNLGPV